MIGQKGCDGTNEGGGWDWDIFACLPALPARHGPACACPMGGTVQPH